jgi:hypothetical protein
MHELTGKITNVSMNYLNQKMQVTLELNERNSTMDMLDELKGHDLLDLKFGKFKQKRSLDANAYCFVLIGKIAEKTRLPKEEVYRNAIKEIGGNYDVVCIQNKAVDSLCNSWRKMGLGWQTDTFDSKIEGCTNVVLYYGSSTYDTGQMSRLIDNIIQDCKSLGIETKPQEELDSLLKGWGK